MTDKLIDALDAGAARLLEMAMAPTVNEDKTINPTTLAERVKAFDSVAKWASDRKELLPKEEKRSQFDVIRDQFHGEPAPVERRGTARKTKKDAGGESDGGSGANANAGSAGSGDAGFAFTDAGAAQLFLA